MRSSIFTIVIFLVFVFSISAQQEHVKKVSTPDEHQTLVSVIESPEELQTPLSFVSTPPQADMTFKPLLRPAISKNMTKDHSKMLALKAEAALEKKSASNFNETIEAEESRGTQFELTNGFYSDLDNACPNDNTIAISNAGRMISMMNNSVGIYTEQGTTINIYSLEAFFNFNVTSPCDPKVEYDPVADRFFMFVQACAPPYENVAMAFSQTNDPNGSWNIYLFPSDAVGDGSWSDYPKVAITRDEVFVSLNQFENGGQGSYQQGIVYQMDKNDGYNGNSLTYKIWTGFPSTTLIIRSGVNQYGPGAYLINTSGPGGNEIVLHDITGNLGDNTSQLKTYKMPVEQYNLPASAYQDDSDYQIDSGDCRAQDGYYQNGIIHFVYTTEEQAYATIRYHRLTPSQLNVENFVTTSYAGTKDYSYPSIAPFTKSQSDQTSIVHFAATGLNSYPEMRAKVFNHDFSFENSQDIFMGSGSMKESCYNPERGYARWGDYSGIAYKYGESTPTVIVAGSVAGSGNNTWWTYIAELEATETATATDENFEKAEVKVFPNPTVEMINVSVLTESTQKVQFILNQSNGTSISNMFTGVIHPGDNDFTFDVSTLSPAVYYLTIKNDQNEILKTEKIIVSH